MGSLKRNLANNILSDGKFDATDLSGTVPASNVNNDSLTNLTTFSPSLGDTIQSVASDPPSLSEGDFWYNTTTGSLKGVVQIKATSSGGNMGTARYGVGGAGTQTAGLAFTGSPGSSPYLSNATEEYNGFSWASGGNYPTNTRFAHGAGTQTAALGFMSDVSPLQLSAEYDGSSWTAGNSLTVPRNRGGGSSNSTQTAGLAFGGNPLSNTTEEYDGTSWTAGGNLNTSRRENPGAGTQTAGLAMGGKNAPTGNTTTTETEEYNGTSWTVVSGVLPTGTSNFNNGAGTQSDAALFGGQNTSGTKVNTIQEYDGAVWSNSSATLASNRSSAGIGTRAQGLIFGGLGTTALNTTEEYFSDIANYSASQNSVWTSGALLGAGRYQMNGQNVGTKDAGLVIGGQGSFPDTAPAVTVSSVEEYNGSSWSEVNNVPTSIAMTGSVGIQTAALQFGGYGGPGAGPNPAPGNSNQTASNYYDGTNWTSAGSLPSAVAYLTGAGTQTAAVSIGGFPALTSCNLYDGSTWTATGSMTTGRHNGSAVGISTAALIIGGAPIPGGVGNDVEEFNGSTWSSSPDLPTNREQASVGGTTASAFAGHGNQPGTNVLTLDWNGTAWSSGVNASQYRYGGTNGGTSTTGGYYAGGGGSASGTQRQSTEEYTFGAPASPTGAAASTITTS